MDADNKCFLFGTAGDKGCVERLLSGSFGPLPGGWRFVYHIKIALFS